MQPNDKAVISYNAKHETHWLIERYEDELAFLAKRPYDVSEIHGNLLLNAGIAALWDLSCGTGAPTAFNAANARIGVGTSTTAAAANQTGLLGTTAFQTMNTSYPQRTNQTQQWQAVFGGSAANFAWNEFCVDNGGTVTLNRVVSAQGTKANGQTWTVTVQITLS